MDNGNLFFFFLMITAVCVIATIYGIRYFKNKENLALIERGINPNADQPQKAHPKPFISLRIGLPLMGAGLGLLIASIIDFNVGRGEHLPGIYFGLIITLGGLGFFLSYHTEMKWWKEDEYKEKQ